MEFGVMFLIILGLIWIVFAVLQDLRKREIANWVNFSLVIFALGFRFFYSFFSKGDFVFFYQGIIGFAIFFVLGNLLYYSRVFAGGDAKLMIALGAILPLSESLYGNLNSFLIFFLIFLIAGAGYGIIYSTILAIKNREKFSKEFSKQFRKNKKIFYFSVFACLILIGLAFIEAIIFYFAFIVFIFPCLYFAAKAIDESCMIKEIDTKKLTEGDWLYKDVKIGKKKIKSKWEGLSRDDIEVLQKRKKKVLIRLGIPYSPVFLIAFLIFILFF